MSHMIFLSEKGFDKSKIVSVAPNIGLVDLKIFFSKNVVKFEYLESGGNMESYSKAISKDIGASSSIGITFVDDCVEFFVVEYPFSPTRLSMSWHMSKKPWKTDVEEYRFLRNMGYNKDVSRAAVGRVKPELKKVVDQEITEDDYKEMLGDDYIHFSGSNENDESDEEFLS